MELPIPPITSIEALEAYTLQYLQNGVQKEQGRLLMTLLLRANRQVVLQVLRAEFPELVGAALPLLTNASTVLRFEADDDDTNQFVYDDEAGQAAMVMRVLSGRPGWVNSPNCRLAGNFTWYMDGSAPANQGPAAMNVTIAGGDTAKVDVPLTGTSTYSDPENDAKADTIHRWYRADNASGLNRTVIAGAQSASYTPTSVDQGKVLQYGAAYTAATGTITGAETLSSYTNVVAAATSGVLPTISANFVDDWASDNMLRPFTGGQPDAFGTTTAVAIRPTTNVSSEHQIYCDISTPEDGKDYIVSFFVGGDYDYLDIAAIGLQAGYPQKAKEIFRLSTREKLINNGGSHIVASGAGYYEVQVKLTGTGYPARLFLRPSPTYQEAYSGDEVKRLLISTPTIKLDA